MKGTLLLRMGGVKSVFAVIDFLSRVVLAGQSRLQCADEVSLFFETLKGKGQY